MKKSILVIAITLLLVSFVGYIQSSTASESPREIICMAMFIMHDQAYGTWVSKHVVLFFEDVEGLPINLNNPALGDGFLKARIFWMSWGEQGVAIRIVMKYKPSISKETANKYASSFSEEVMKVINQTDTSTFFTKTYIDNATNTLIVIRDYGFLPDNVNSIDGLLKYKPAGGFADLITDNLLEKYVPSRIDSSGIFGQSMTELEYTLWKTNGYHWNFKIGFSSHSELDEEFMETLDLKSLIYNNDSIRPSNRRNSEIIIEIPKKHRTNSGIYKVTFEDFDPSPDTTVEEDGFIKAVYKLHAPIDNVVTKIRIELETSDNLDQKIIIVVGLLILAFVLVVVFKKKVKGGEKGIKIDGAGRYINPPHSWYPLP